MLFRRRHGGERRTILGDLMRLLGPGLINIDVSVLRNFRVTERVGAELRGEFFNALNHTNFGNPGATFGSSNFGLISSAGPARQIEVGVRILF